MKPAIVGCHVGLRVGNSSGPDMNRRRGMNNLDRDCRECRVFIGGETAQRFQNSMLQARGILKLFTFWDLNDAQS